MAISRKYQAKTTITAAEHSQLVTRAAELGKQRIEILSAVANPDATVTVTFYGQGLGKNAVLAPLACKLSITPNAITVLPIPHPSSLIPHP